MADSDTGATQQHIFNKNISNQPSVKYNNPATSGKKQDQLRNRQDTNIHS
jgi:hypothetical protein